MDPINGVAWVNLVTSWGNFHGCLAEKEPPCRTPLFLCKDFCIAGSENSPPPKTNMTGWKITIFDRRYIFKWLVFHCHSLVFCGFSIFHDPCRYFVHIFWIFFLLRRLVLLFVCSIAMLVFRGKQKPCRTSFFCAKSEALSQEWCEYRELRSPWLRSLEKIFLWSIDGSWKQNSEPWN